MDIGGQFSSLTIAIHSIAIVMHNSSEVGPPSVNLRVGGYQVGPPSANLRVGGYQVGPPSADLRAWSLWSSQC